MPIPSSVVSMPKSPDPPDPLRPSSPSVQASLTHLSIPTSPLKNAEEEPLNSVEVKEPGPRKNTLRRRKSRSRSRGRKNARNNDTQEANMSQTQASGKQWVPIEIQQYNTVVTKEFKSDDSEPEKAEAAEQHEASLVDKVDKTEALEYAKVEGEVLEVSDHKKEEAVATESLPSAVAFGDKESTDTDAHSKRA
ncbi:hypothetical protein F2Q68_00004146 [Brassica cretica]|uniref:Uncharacterized protein n=1 Tax=Brassica cretica TaxID=69181 RepID=A0A8S9JJ28_BRACR|nr:hypothetical protein F2Q68_00004146 [Brassica cretica]